MIFALDGEDTLEIACSDEDGLPTGPELEYINRLFTSVKENITEIDEVISGLSHGFSFDRIFKTDLAVIRMGVAEIKYMDTDNIIATSEAVAIAKKYGTEKSGGFVNGILAKVITA